PPDLAAIDAIWAQIQLQLPNTYADRVFFDRMVEGYANVGDIGKMMAFLARTTHDRKQPSWRTLATVVRRLAEIGDWERCREVVREARRGEAEMVGRQTGRWRRYERAHFEWTVAQVLGDGEGGGEEYNWDGPGEEEDKEEDKEEDQEDEDEDGREDIDENGYESQFQDETYREVGSGALDEQRPAFARLTASH
ncbi:MAG: hypothetical protein Q9157_008807, partial [Trypethelium eluteriae]